MDFVQSAFSSQPSSRRLRAFALAALVFSLMAQAWAAPRVVVISLDGCKPAIVQQLLASGALSPNQGIGLLLSRGAFATGSLTVSPSLTAPNHIALATGSSAAHNDIPSNTFHLVASPFTSTISGFGAPIGGYNFVGPAESLNPTAEPLWVALRNAGKTVVTATWPGGDGVDVLVPGLTNSPIIQAHGKRTVDYTVPFGEFGGVGGKGFTLTAANFAPAPQPIVDALTAAGHTSFSPVLLTTLETITVGGVSFTIQVATLDTTDDATANYDTLVFFDTTNGIKPGPFSLPSTGPAYVKFSDGTSQPFYFEGTPKQAGAGFFVTALAPDLSTVHLVRYSADDIPRNAPVLANVDDINNNVGFWADQHDFRFPERINPGLSAFSDLELEALDQDLNTHFVDYQTRVALRAMSQTPNADLVMIYIEEPDGFEHQYLLTDPRQPTNPLDPTSILAGQDPAKIARYQKLIESAYQTADQAVQRIIDSVGVDSNGLPLADIFLVSDHGFAPFHTAVNIFNLLVANGIDTSKVRAVTSGPAANIYISLKGREPNGTVSKADYLKLKKKIQGILTSYVDTNPNYTNGASSVPVFEKVFVRPTPGGVGDPDFGLDTKEFIGQDSGDIYALMSIGYNFDGTQSPVVQRLGDAPSSAPVLSVPNFYGAHGHNPNQPDMNAFFAAAGPDIKPGLIKRSVHQVDLAPTVETLLGVTPAATVDGTPLLTILKK
jgi:predicted AlkP superfamily pyrophosphatase or phosphodiesterase